MIHLITGGSASGKSAYAEQLIRVETTDTGRIYLATMVKGNDSENAARIQKHRDRRESLCFQTIEQATGLKDLEIPKGSTVLLEDVPNLLANEMFSPAGNMDLAVSSVLDGLHHLMEQAGNLYIVTGEVFTEGIEVYDDMTLRYLENLGRIHQDLGKRADAVTEVVYGIPVKIKEYEK